MTDQPGFIARSAAIILAGGNGVRLGGPKWNRMLGGQTWLQHIVAAVRPCTESIVVMVHPDQLRDAAALFPDVTVFADPVADQGPLAALVEGFEQLPRSVDRAFVTGCDRPLLTTRVVRWLLEQSGEEWITWVESSQPQPMLGVYRREVVTVASPLLASGGRSFKDLAQACPPRTMEAAALRAVDPEHVALLDVNDLEQLERLNQRYAQQRSTELAGG